MLTPRKSLALSIAFLSLAGCMDENQPLGTAPEVEGEAVALAEVTCRVDLRGGEIGCAPAEGSARSGASAAILAWQATNVLLESRNVAYSDEIFSADVAVRNFLTQDIGTDADGVQVFFLEEPAVTAGTGSVSVRNATGHADFTGTNQAYFAYSGPIAPGMRSAELTWQWDVSGAVDEFTFKVAVKAAVADENDLTPAVQLNPTTIVARQAHTCALDQNGKAYCWGVNTDGQLGTGDNVDRLVPTPVVGDLTFDTIAVGTRHTCGITTDGTAYCWGANQYGRLGNGTETNQNTPVLVSTSLKFKQIGPGHDHTCAVTVDDDGYCWGRGNFAKLGNKQAGANYFEAFPVPVSGGIKFKLISAGNEHTCGLDVNGKAYCWGNDGSGQAGVGVGGRVDSATAVLGDRTYQTIISGTTYTCGLTVEGEIYCFGVNASEMQGHGLREGDNPVAQNEPIHPVAGGHTWKFLTASHAHTCGIDANDELYCWGNRGNSRLGLGSDPTTGNMPTPAKVATGEKFVAAAVAWTYTCGITTGAKVYCWGEGSNGRLGNGSTTSHSTPVLVSPVSQ